MLGKIKKVLWFSRHEMSQDQKTDLQRIYGDISITQVNKTIQSVYELKDDINNYDIIAIVAPIHLQQQFLKIAKDKPIISCRNKRVFDPADNTKVNFVFDGWYQIVKIEVATKDL